MKGSFLQKNFHVVEFQETTLSHLVDLTGVEELEFPCSFVVVVHDGDTTMPPLDLANAGPGANHPFNRRLHLLDFLLFWFFPVEVSRSRLNENHETPNDKRKEYHPYTIANINRPLIIVYKSFIYTGSDKETATN